MIQLLTQFGEASSSGIGALGLNLKTFLFQLVSFVIVLLILRKYAFPKIVATIENRRATLEKSLEQAKQTEETLKSAEEKAHKLLKEARAQADEALAEARESSKELVAAAEAKAAEHTRQILADAQTQLALESEKLRRELKAELAALVTVATEKIINQKLDAEKDRHLIEVSLKDLKL